MISALISGSFNSARAISSETSYYAIIICSCSEPWFLGDAAYMYHILRYHYAFDEIYYLHTFTDYEGVNASATKDNVRLAINTTLASWSDENDSVFIFFTDHGCGYDVSENMMSSYARIDGSMGDPLDEGNEIWNETSSEWIGVDECLKLAFGKYYFDDEFKQDLDCLTYGRLVVAIMACHSGGFIDDLSGENRTIMTAANETYSAAGEMYLEEGGWDTGNGTRDMYCEWAEALLDGLHGEDTYYNPETQSIVHKNVAVQADASQDGHVSMLEAWQYAWNNSDGRIHGNETNWLDDNNNGLPTYVNGSDNATGPCDTGNLAATVWFSPRHYNLTVQAYDYWWYNSEISGADIWVDAGYVGGSPWKREKREGLGGRHLPT